MAFRLLVRGAAVLFALLAGSAVSAQPARITGIVTDGTRPLDNATVEIFGTKRSQRTPARSGSSKWSSMPPRTSCRKCSYPVA